MSKFPSIADFEAQAFSYHLISVNVRDEWLPRCDACERVKLIEYASYAQRMSCFYYALANNARALKVTLTPMGANHDKQSRR